MSLNHLTSESPTNSWMNIGANRINSQEITSGVVTASQDFEYQKGFAEAYNILEMSNVTNCPIALQKYLVNFGTDITGVSNGFTISSAGRVTYNGNRPRWFHSGVTISHFDTSGGWVEFCLAKNGVELPGSCVRMNANLNGSSSAIHKIMILEPGDYVELYCSAENGGQSVNPWFVNLFFLGLPNVV